MGKYGQDELSEQLHGPIVTTAVTVSGGPTVLPDDPLPGRKDAIVYNQGPSLVYLGGEGVTWDDGIPVEVEGTFALPLARAGLYATVSGSDPYSVVRVLEAT